MNGEERKGVSGREENEEPNRGLGGERRKKGEPAEAMTSPRENLITIFTSTGGPRFSFINTRITWCTRADSRNQRCPEEGGTREREITLTMIKRIASFQWIPLLPYAENMAPSDAWISTPRAVKMHARDH